MTKEDVKVLRNTDKQDCDEADFLIVSADEITDTVPEDTEYDFNYTIYDGNSSCWDDLRDELTERFPGLELYLDDDHVIQIDEENSEEEALAFAKANNQKESIRDFASQWREDNEYTNESLFWSYWDGRNHQDELVDTNTDLQVKWQLLDDDDDTDKIKNVYARCQEKKDYDSPCQEILDEETGYTCAFSIYANHGWLAQIYKNKG